MKRNLVVPRNSGSITYNSSSYYRELDEEEGSSTGDATTESGSSTASTSSVVVDDESYEPYRPVLYRPTEITLRTGVYVVPPFNVAHESDNNNNNNNNTTTTGSSTTKFTGFIPDLLKSLQQFALLEDNVTLKFEFQRAPSTYNGALDLVANDCYEVVTEDPHENCRKLDLIVGNYYASPGRSLRVHLTPSWLRSTTSTMKYLEANNTATEEITTMTEATNANATVCLQGATYHSTKVIAKYPHVNYYLYTDSEDGIRALKSEKCVLLCADEMELRYLTAWDPTLEVTREQWNTNYVVWPMSFDLPLIVHQYMGRWLYMAVTGGIVDDLYSRYFQKALCPVGTAGESCELPCHPIYGSADIRGVCVCRSTKHRGNDCSVEVPENTHNIPAGLKGAAYGMVGINVLTILVLGCWLFWQRNSTQVKISQPNFLRLVLLGCLISTSTIVVLAQEDEGYGPVRACMAIPWLYSVGFSVTFGTLYAKIRRLYILFDAALGCNHQVVTTRETLQVIGIVLLVDVTILVIWTLVDPLRWYREVTLEDQFGEPLESVGYCTSDHWIIFATVIALLHLLLLCVATYTCYRARNIPTKFSEGKYVTIAMVSNLQIFVVGVPILIILGADSQAGFFVRSVIIFMNDFAVVTLIFGNLIYSTHFAPPQSRQVSVRTAVGSAMKSYGNNHSVFSNLNKESKDDGNNAASAPARHSL